MQCDFRKQNQTTHKYTRLNCTLAVTQLWQLMIRQHSKFRHSLSKLELSWTTGNKQRSQNPSSRFCSSANLRQNFWNLWGMKKSWFPWLSKKNLLSFQMQDLGDSSWNVWSFYIFLCSLSQFWGLLLTNLGKKGLIRLYVRPSWLIIPLLRQDCTGF